MRLTVVGCSGSYPGPDSPASCYLSRPRTGGRTWRILLDLGNGALGALQRYVDPLDDRRGASQPPARRPLPRPVRLLRDAQVPPRGPQPRIPVWGPAGTAERMAAAYDLPERPGHDRGVRLPRLRRRRSRSARSRSRPCRSSTPCRPTPCGSRAGGRDARLLRRHRAVRRRSTRSPPGPTCCSREASFRRGDDNPPDLHLTGADCGRGGRAPRPVQRLVLTHIPPWHDPADRVAEARRRTTARSSWRRAGATYDV